MTYQKKAPQAVRESRLAAAARMREAREKKRAERKSMGIVKEPVPHRKPIERGLTTIQINIEDAELLAKLAAERKTSRRLFLHDVLQSLYGKKS